MNRVPAYEDLITKANHPLIRMFNAPMVTAAEPQDNIGGEWTAASPETVGGYSAVAFFFARYAWAANPEGANLVNSEGLPASVFRTDNWDDVIADAGSAKALSERRALGVEIRALAAKKAGLDRKSAEFKAIAEKHAALMKKFRAMAPAQNPK
jgi:hypothetical protein